MKLSKIKTIATKIFNEFNGAYRGLRLYKLADGEFALVDFDGEQYLQVVSHPGDLYGWGKVDLNDAECIFSGNQDDFIPQLESLMSNLEPTIQVYIRAIDGFIYDMGNVNEVQLAYLMGFIMSSDETSGWKISKTARGNERQLTFGIRTEEYSEKILEIFDRFYNENNEK